MIEKPIISGEYNVIHYITNLRQICPNNIATVGGTSILSHDVIHVGYSYSTPEGNVAVVAVDTLTNLGQVFYVKNNYNQLFSASFYDFDFGVMCGMVGSRTAFMGRVCELEIRALLIAGCFVFPYVGTGISAIKLMSLYYNNQRKFDILIEKLPPLYTAAMLVKDNFPITTRKVLYGALRDSVLDALRPGTSPVDIAKAGWTFVKLAYEVYTRRFEQLGSSFIKQIILFSKARIKEKLGSVKEIIIDIIRHPIRNARESGAEHLVGSPETILHQIESDTTLFRRITSDFASINNSYSLNLSDDDVRAIIREMAERRDRFHIIEDFSTKADEVVRILDELNQEMERTAPPTSL